MHGSLSVREKVGYILNEAFEGIEGFVIGRELNDYWNEANQYRRDTLAMS
jgi:hypothetical protein